MRDDIERGRAKVIWGRVTRPEVYRQVWYDGWTYCLMRKQDWPTGGSTDEQWIAVVWSN